MSVLINNNGTLNPIAGNGIQNTFTGTEAEVTAAMAAGEIAEGTVVYITDDNGVGVNAEDVVYDNTESELTADDVQGAIDEIKAKFDEVVNKETVVARASANSTYAEQLTAIETAFSNLTDTQKFHCHLISGNDRFECVSKNGIFTASQTTATTAYTTTFNIPNHTILRLETTSSGSSINNRSSANNSYDLVLTCNL